MKRFRELGGALLVIVLAGVSAQCDQENLADWGSRAPIGFDAAPAQGLVEFPLSEEVFDGARTDLADLRVVDDAGTPVAHVTRAPEWKRQDKQLPATLFNAAYIPGAQACVTADFPAKVLKNRVEISTSGTNFWRKVNLESSDNGEIWHMVVEGAVLIRKEGDAVSPRYEKNLVSFPPNDERYLRITVFTAPTDPERIEITGVSVWQHGGERPETVEVPVVGSSAVQIAKENATEIELDLGWRNLPLDEITLDFREANFFRRVSVLGRNQETEVVRTAREDAPPEEKVVEVPWEHIGDGAMYRFSPGRAPEEKLAVDVSGRGYRYIKVRLHNASDPPLEFAGAKASRFTRYAAFQAKEGRKYALYFGNPKAARPGYDLARYADRLRGEGIVKAALGKAEAIGGKAAERVIPWSEKHKWLIWAALVAAVAVLALLILRTAKSPGGGQGGTPGTPAT